MSQSSHQQPPRPSSPPGTGNDVLIGNLLKIASLAAQAYSNPKFVQDHEFALGILREAHSLTNAWLVEVRKEVEHLGLLDRSDRGNGPGPSKKSASSWLLIAAKVAAMRWKAAKMPRVEDKGAWRRKILKEIYHHLEAHVGDAEDEIKRLERMVERKYHKHRSHVRSNTSDVRTTGEGGEMVDQLRGDEGYDVNPGMSPRLSHYRKQRVDKQQPEEKTQHRHAPENLAGTTRYWRSRSRQPQVDREHSANRSVPVHDGPQIYPPPQVQHPLASVGENFEYQPARVSFQDDTRSSHRSLQPEFLSDQPHLAGQPRVDVDTTEEDPGLGNEPGTAPYEHPQTVSMPKSPNSVTDSHSSRQTRAPTVSSKQSTSTSIKAAATPALSEPSQNCHSSGAGRYANSHARLGTSNASQRALKGHEQSEKSTIYMNAGGNGCPATNSSHTISQSTHYPDTSIHDVPSQGRTAYNQRHTQERNSAASSSTPKSSIAGKGSHHATPIPTVVNDSPLPQPLPTQAPAAWSFASLGEPLTRPPSGMSCHVGSQRQSRTSSHRPSHTSERSGLKSRKQSHAGAGRREAEDVVRDADGLVSEVSFIGYKRPQGTNKCHHKPPEENCSSVTASLKDQGPI